MTENPIWEFIVKVAEAYASESEAEKDRLHALADTFFAFVSAANLHEIQLATESLDRSATKLVASSDSLVTSSGEMVTLTKWVRGLTVALVAETVVLAVLVVMFRG